MTKEEAQKELWDMFPDSLVTVEGYHNAEKLINKIFESNVCIPKGENCHPYHMELHQWAENPLVNLEAFNDEKGSFELSLFDEYRIKTSDPIYEYLWLDLRAPNTYDLPTTKYMTNDEADNYFGCRVTNIIRVNETKRERK